MRTVIFKLKMVERTKEHHKTKQAEQPDSKEYSVSIYVN